MSIMKMGMSSTRMKSRYESLMMTKAEEEDEEWISSPHAPQSTTPKGNARERRLLMAKTSPDADIWRKRPVFALDGDQKKNVAPECHPASLKSERGPTSMTRIPDWPWIHPASEIHSERGPTMSLPLGSMEYPQVRKLRAAEGWAEFEYRPTRRKKDDSTGPRRRSKVSQTGTRRTSVVANEPRKLGTPPPTKV